MRDAKTGKDQRIKVVFYGLGSIGSQAAKIALSRPNLAIAGVVDTDSAKVGEDLGTLLKLSKKVGITVVDRLDKITSRVKADVVVHTTVSSLKTVNHEILEICSAKMHCVSSTEELFFPYLQDSEDSAHLDKIAKEHGVTILGTGVNPGFVMDVLPLLLTGVCQKVERIKVERVVDVSTRRLPLQKKIGVGLAIEEFRQETDKKKIGHVGLPQSLAFLVQNLGWKLDEIKEKIDPAMATRNLSTKYFSIGKGKNAGIKQTASGIKDGQERITLNLEMYVGAKDPHDLILIEGIPDLNVRIDGGIPGDIATAAILLNSVPVVIKMKPGLITMEDVVPLHWRSSFLEQDIKFE